MTPPRTFPRLERREARGEPLVLQSQRITLVKRVLCISWYGASYTWERPAAVEVTRDDGSQRRVPIRDTTRLVRIGTVVAALVAPVFVWWREQTRR